MTESSAATEGRTIPDEASVSTTPQADVIDVALIEDNLLVREALISLLNRAPDIRATAIDPNVRDTLLEGDPDVVLLDLGLENGDSLRVTRRVLEEFPEVKVIVMDLLPAHEELKQFVNAGVAGFVMKDAPLDEVLNTIRSVASGLKVLPDKMTATLFSEIAKEMAASGVSVHHEGVLLTPRQREVIDLIADGMSNKVIAKELHISVHTVKSHLRNIMEKLALRSRLQLAVWVHERDDAESE